MGGAHYPPRRGGVARRLNRSWRAGREARARAKRKRDSAQPQEKGEASTATIARRGWTRRTAAGILGGQTSFERKAISHKKA